MVLGWPIVLIYSLLQLVSGDFWRNKTGSCVCVDSCHVTILSVSSSRGCRCGGGEALGVSYFEHKYFDVVHIQVRSIYFYVGSYFEAFSTSTDTLFFRLWFLICVCSLLRSHQRPLRYDEALTFLLDAEELLGIYGLDVPDLSLPAAHDFDT